MPGLPKKYAKMGFKAGWKAYKAKNKKSTGKVKKLVKRRYTRKAKRRRRRDKRIPFSVAVGLGVAAMAPPTPGWISPLQAVQEGRFDLAAQSFVRSMTGIAIGGIGGQVTTTFNIMDTLNPFNMNEAPAIKTMFWSALILKIQKSVFHINPIANIPFVKKFLKWS